MDDIAFDPGRAIEALTRSRVRFVLIGGLAANIHGSPMLTGDVDICYARDRENLENLAAALRGLNARLRGAPPDVPFQLDAETLRRGDHLTFATDAGALDILGTAAGVEGYDDLEAHASRAALYGADVLIASIDDLIRMKLAAGRPKDLRAVEELDALREVIEEEDGS